LQETGLDEPNGLILNIREGVVFHDGEALTDTVLDELLKDHFLPASHHQWLFAEMSDSVGAVSRVSLEEESGSALGLALTQTPALFSSGLELLRPVRGSFHSMILGTGPFGLSQTNADTTWLKAREHHWCGRPFLDGIALIQFESEKWCESALIAGDVDAAWLRRGLLDPGAGHSLTRIEEQESVWFIGMNSSSASPRKHDFLNSSKQRSAFVQALRLDELTSALLGGQSTAAKSIFIPQTSVPAASEALITLSNRNQEHPVRVIYPKEVSEGRIIARRVQAVLLESGFQPVLLPLTESELQHRLELKQFDIIVGSVLLQTSDTRVNLASFYSNYVQYGPFSLPDSVQPHATGLYRELYFNGEIENAVELEQLILASSAVVPVVRTLHELWISGSYELNEVDGGGISDLWLIESE
jgi:MarR-like DNA-binding transcriptional regulator SgrR of sgrS sRNA